MTLSTPNIEQVVIILSSGRTGTTALAKYLNDGCRSVTALHEPKPSRILRIASARFLAGRTSRANMALLLERKRRKLYAGIGTPIYVESNPYLYGFLDVLGEVFERPKIVHITRDPRTSIRSVLNFGAHQGLKRLFLELVPYWTIRPEHLERRPQQTWRQMSLLERTAWYWRVINSHLDRGAELYGEDYRRFHYEDLFRAGGGGLCELTNWIGLRERENALTGLLETKLNPSRGTRTPTWEHWNDFDRNIVIEECGTLMQKYGYAPVSTTSLEFL